MSVFTADVSMIQALLFAKHRHGFCCLVGLSDQKLNSKKSRKFFIIAVDFWLLGTYHTDLEQNWFFALFKPIILQFFTILQDKLRSFNIVCTTNYRMDYIIKRFHEDNFPYCRDCSVRKICSYVISRVIIMGF